MQPIYAPDYDRDEKGRVLFPPRDTNLRALYFPFTDPTQHVAKSNMFSVRELVKLVAEPGQIICDPFAGTGTILVAYEHGCTVSMVELEDHFIKTIEQNIKGISMQFPEAKDAMVLQGDVRDIFPIVDFCNHMIFSPPYAQVLRKKGEMDQASKDLGYASATLFSESPENIANLNDFLYTQTMQKVYKKFYDSIIKGGTMTIIIKDRTANGERICYADKAQQLAERVGFKLYQRNQWYARGGGYSAVNRQKGIETIDEEDLITMVKE